MGEKNTGVQTLIRTNKLRLEDSGRVGEAKTLTLSCVEFTTVDSYLKIIFLYMHRF